MRCQQMMLTECHARVLSNVIKVLCVSQDVFSQGKRAMCTRYRQCMRFPGSFGLQSSYEQPHKFHKRCAYRALVPGVGAGGGGGARAGGGVRQSGAAGLLPPSPLPSLAPPYSASSGALPTGEVLLSLLALPHEPAAPSAERPTAGSQHGEAKPTGVRGKWEDPAHAHLAPQDTTSIHSDRAS